MTLKSRVVADVQAYLIENQLPLIRQFVNSQQSTETTNEMYARIRPSVARFVEVAVAEKLARDSPVAASGVTTSTVESVNGEAKK